MVIIIVSDVKLKVNLDCLPLYSECDRSFVMVPQTLSFFGKREPRANTVSQCRRACLEQPGCLAFDFNRYGQRIILHKTETCWFWSIGQCLLEELMKM